MIRENTKKLLEHCTHNNQWLIDQWSTELETHIYVKPGTDEEAHPSKANCWSNGVHTWKQIRWPYNASSIPNFKDFLPEFPLDPEAGYIESVGTSWFNWETQESHAVFFDFDLLTDGGHAAGLPPEVLEEVLKKILQLDYVTVIRSTSGTGYHVLVFFEKGYRPKVVNHNEHSLVAEVVLQKMSEDADFEFKSKVDCFGLIGWIWSTRATEENKGFSMVKQASRNLKSSEIADWTKLPSKRMRHRPRVVAYDIDGKEVKGNNILGINEIEVPIDKEHLQIIKALEKTKYSFAYMDEHKLFHTHTSALEEVHRSLKLKGPYKTSTGQTTLCNCFIRPLKGGGFAVFRFGQGTLEHPLWDHTGPTTWCTFNQTVPYHKVMLRMGADYIPESKCYEFENHKDLVKCVNVLGNKVHLKLLNDRQYTVHVTGRGMVIHCRCDKEERPGDCDGWERARGYFKKVLSRLEEMDTNSALPHIDAIVRNVVRDGEKLGWSYHTEKGWVTEKTEAGAVRAVRCVIGGKDVQRFLDIATKNPWEEVNVPFQPEVLSGREWNRNSAQLITQCSPKSGPHPHWDRILAHVGQGLDEPLKDNEAMQAYGICTGADYMRAWIACLIRHPEDPLPYMFLVGPQNTGKSLCHEVLRECFKKGVVHGGNALASGAGFNGEFEGRVLAAIDETDLSTAPGLAGRLKAWSNCTYMPIHKKGQQPYDAKNYMHFWQTGNSVTVCVIEQGDTRIIVLEVPRFEGKEIPKPVFTQHCLDELPNFLYTLGTMKLPPMTGRTRLPVISTEIKEGILESGESDVFGFLKSEYHDVDGHYVKVSDAYEGYKKWCVASNVKPVAPNDFKLQIGLKYPVHKGPSGRAYTIGNLSSHPNAEPKPAFTLEGHEGRHVRV